MRHSGGGGGAEGEIDRRWGGGGEARKGRKSYFFLFRSWRAGKALLPDTRESSRNQESEQSSATIVPQLSVVADMTRR